MKSLYLKILLFLALILRGGIAFGQVPVNDDCETATNIPNAKDICGKYTNVGATKGNYESTNCFAIGDNDVWFTFTAVATTVTINVYGKSVSTPNFTLVNPQAVLYYGECGKQLSELGCGATSASSSGSLDVTKSGLIVGEKYLIRVAGRTSGTFDLCIKNYNLPAKIDSDCPTAAVLCDKSPFSVKFLVGEGKIPNEFDDAPCLNLGGTASESNSAWFQWTCQTSGTLTLKITPNFLGDSITPTGSQQVIGDDLDFAVYELTGLGNCSGKKLLRCEAAGPYVESGCNVQAALRCFGATGLRESAASISEGSGCPCGQPRENFVKALDMEAGKTYTIGINNFSGTGNGFSIQFGGSGTFVGPEAKINIDRPNKKYCIGEDVTFNDASSFGLGKITKRAWKFGKDASIDTASSIGPYKVFYKSPGWKAVVLTVETDRGCVVTSILDSIYIAPFEYDSTKRPPTCRLGTDGLLRLRVVNCGRPPFLYNWENGAGFASADSVSGLRSGRYRVSVKDATGYTDTVVFFLRDTVIELNKASVLKKPSCFGNKDARITVSPSSGTKPFSFRWTPDPFPLFRLNDSLRGGIEAGTYTIEVRDQNECKGQIEVNIIPPDKLEVQVEPIDISCFNTNPPDGKAVAFVAGGTLKSKPPYYTIGWSNGSIGDTVFNLDAKTWFVVVSDSNFCSARADFTIKRPPILGFNLPIITRPAKCFGDSTAAVIFQGAGGRPPFRYSIDGVRFQKDSAFLKIPALDYRLVIRDSSGCRTDTTISILQPPQLKVLADGGGAVQLGFTTDLRAVVVPSNRLVSYAWTPRNTVLSCFDCSSPTVFPLNNQTYRVTVRDSAGCTAFDDVLVEVLKKRPIFIPTVFSPNGDGVNDFFTVYGNQAATSVRDFKIFSRWGELMYQKQDFSLNVDNLGWNGTFNGVALQPDVYAFYAVIRFIDGEEILYKGDVTLVK